MDAYLIEVYADAVLDRYQRGEWELPQARNHVVRAFELFATDGEAFFDHAMAAIRSDDA